MKVDLDGLAKNIKDTIGGERADEMRFMVDELISHVKKMEADNRFIFCSFCGHRTERSDDVAAMVRAMVRAMMEHIIACENHPLRAAVAFAQVLEESEARLLTACKAVRDELLSHMVGAWPGTMSITAKRVGELINAAIAKAERPALEKVERPS